MKNKHNLTIGADPELFIQNNERIISAEGIIPGTKLRPMIFEEGFGLQLDNMAAEFNIPASSTLEDFTKNLEFGLGFIKDFVGREGFSISKEAVANNFSPKELSTKNAQRFGCDPDYCVWTESMNAPPKASNTLRTVAGHVHIGFDQAMEVNDENCERVMKAFDLFVTLPSILTDPDRMRRAMYGKAGAFRVKPYGIEARTLSNFWIFDKNSIKMIWEGTLMATNFAIEQPNELNKLISNENLTVDIQNAINYYQEDKVKNLIETVLEPIYAEYEELVKIH